MRCTSARSPARRWLLPEGRTMYAESSITSVSGDIQVAGTLTPEIAVPGALYAVDLSPLRPHPELLPPFGCETALWGRAALTKTEEHETIIINRSDRSTYPDQKSVLRGGATPYRRPQRGGSGISDTGISGFLPGRNR